MNQALPPPDPDDLFSDTRMSFGDHLEDLRTHLIRAIVCFLVGVVACIYPLGTYVLRIIVKPVEDQLEAFYKRANAKQVREILANPKTMEKLAGGRGLRVGFSRKELLAALGIQKTDPMAGLMRGADHLFERLELDELVDPQLYRADDLVEIRVRPLDQEQMLKFFGKTADLIKPPQRLSTFNVMEALVVYIKVALLSGLVLSSPFVFWNIWMFVAAGLYPHEKRLVNVYLPFSLGLFLTGVMVCQFLVMPRAVEALLWFNEWLGFQPELRLNEWLNFALMMPLVFGISFQTPLVMLFINKIGVVSVQGFRDYRKIAWFALAVFAAIITPSIDAYTMVLLWVPMGLLYELGIHLCVWQGGPITLDEVDNAPSEEMVEV